VLLLLLLLPQGWAEYSEGHFKQLRKMIMDMVFEQPLVSVTNR
jgi:hypothetical protein